MSPPEPIPFPTTQSDRKSSPMMAPQRPGSTPGLSQGEQNIIGFTISLEIEISEFNIYDRNTTHALR